MSHANRPAAADPQISPVTGVARGALGTATNLDDTQVFLLDELQVPPPPIDPAPAQPAAPMPPPQPIRRVQPVPRARRAARPSRGAGSRAGVIVAAGLAIVAIATLLTLRDGGASGPDGLGGGGDVTYDQGTGDPPLATTEPAPTVEPEGGGNDGRGNGNGNGRGNGGGNGGGKPR